VKLSRSGLIPFIELFVLLTVVGVGVIFALCGVLSLNGCIWLTLAILVVTFCLAWIRFDGGRHPCFLFLGTLLLFQGGRLIGFACDVTDQPMQIVLMSPAPVSVARGAAEVTLLLLALSSIAVYAPCRLGRRQVRFFSIGGHRWLPAVYTLIVFTLPFSIYKDLTYLFYIRSHGGYLSVFTNNTELLASAGFSVRALSTINITAILVAYILENRRGRLRVILSIFVLLSSLDMLLGFRGEFFAQVLSIWLIHKLRTGRRFQLVPLTVIFVVASTVAVVTAEARENQNIELLSPLSFVATQGNSLNVTEAAVQYHDTFSHFGWSYIWHGFVNGVTPISPGHGELWTTDLSYFLNPFAAERGFGTASSYLAELFLFGGIPAILAGSLLIGLAFSCIYRFSDRFGGALILLFVLPSLIYLPRLELLAPLAILVKSLVSFGLIVCFIYCYQCFAAFVRMACSEISGVSE